LYKDSVEFAKRSQKLLFSPAVDPRHCRTLDSPRRLQDLPAHAQRRRPDRALIHRPVVGDGLEALWPAGTFASAYDANRKAVVEGIIEADPLAGCIRKLIAERGSWAGTASDLLRVTTGVAGDHVSTRKADWPKLPAGLTGRPRRAQTFLRMLGIEISFSREGRAGTRTIRLNSGVENRAANVSSVSTVSTVSTVCHDISVRSGKQPQGVGHSSSA
jgi:hypothetical protein